jgi:hypothetical protein
MECAFRPIDRDGGRAWGETHAISAKSPNDRVAARGWGEAHKHFVDPIAGGEMRSTKCWL